MKFGRTAIADAEGAILAHSVRLRGTRLRKGRVLSPADIKALAADGIDTVVAARLDPTDVAEDDAAARIAARMAAPGISLSAPFTGRANAFAERPGLLRVDADAVDRLNRIDEAITVATLPDATRVAARSMLATVKIIPYAVSDRLVAAAEASLEAPLRLHPFAGGTASLIITRLPGTGDGLVDKGRAAVAARLSALNLTLVETLTCNHDDAALAATLGTAAGEMVLILTASATSDRDDTGPAAVRAVGGRITRFGMPVDPGNLLFLADWGDRTVVGLPGCARSPALNGADWVLERLAAGQSVSGDDIAAMGVGGLLKEIATRPQPRGGNRTAPERPRVEVIVLAAGASRRMAGRDKLLEPIGAQPLLTRMARAALGSAADRVQVALPPDRPERAAALDGLDVVRTIVPTPDEGMGASLRAAMAARAPTTDAVVILLADMPEIDAAAIDRLIAAFDPHEGRTIVRATTADGRPGHPVLFGRRFFESLMQVTGDVGARDVVRASAAYLVDVALPGDAAVTDLDTPDAWAAWRQRSGD